MGYWGGRGVWEQRKKKEGTLQPFKSLVWLLCVVVQLKGLSRAGVVENRKMGKKRKKEGRGFMG